MAAVAYAREQNIKIHQVCPFGKMLFKKTNLLGWCDLLKGYLKSNIRL